MKKIISVLIAFATVLSLTVFAQARLVGDVNSDGKVTSGDALLVLLFSVGQSDDINQKIADVDGNGSINSSDALAILQICVGSYTGDLEVPDELITHYHDEVIAPIFKTGCFTMVTDIEAEGKLTRTKIMVDGKNLCADMTVEGISARFLVLNGENYLVFPSLRVYTKAPDSIDITIPSGGTGDNGSVYVKSEYVTVDGVKYVCETYKFPDGSLQNYYFLNGKWKILETISDDGTTVQKIQSLTAGVDKSAFSLKGMVEWEIPNE